MEDSVGKTTVGERTEKDKQSLAEALKEMPIVQFACRKAGVSRATYYRWRQEDKEFRRESDDALNQGYEYINDMGESQVIALIKEKKLPAITLWLKHHHPRYGAQARQYVPPSEEDDLTAEEERMVLEALSLSSGRPVRRLGKKK
ncbi:MAG: hypothetical protein M1153_00815 [Patescibacteria group bacterium]|nr:hypothetical protein [Patescibacteria group bacterium]